jgi:Predicted pPIWI-associating nuclease
LGNSRHLSWRELKGLARALQKRMQKDRFFRTVVQGCFRVGQDKQNPLRGNFSASGLREAIGHLLHNLAPDQEVRACVWFVQAKDTPTVTRQQRASYIVRAGLPDGFVSDTLNLDVRELTKPLIEMMNGLNKVTHVRPDTILSDGAKIRQMVQEVLQGIDQLLEAAAGSREAITRAVADVMHKAVFEKFISETIQELDELSTHTMVEGHQIEEVTVTKLDWKEIGYCVTGKVEVELQYGSDSDVDKDLGFRQDDAYPYIVTVTCPVAQPMDVRAGDLDVAVDNHSFFE